MGLQGLAFPALVLGDNRMGLQPGADLRYRSPGRSFAGANQFRGALKAVVTEAGFPPSAAEAGLWPATR